MSASTANVDVMKAIALECLEARGTRTLHPSLSLAHIKRADRYRLHLDVPVRELAKIQAGTRGTPMSDIIQYGENASTVALSLGFDGTPPEFQTISSQERSEVFPFPDELLRIRGEAEMRGGVPVLKFVVQVSRRKVFRTVCLGFQTMCLSPTVAAPPPPQPVVPNAPSTSGPPPPPPKKRRSAPGPSQPPPKRPSALPSAPQPSSSAPPPPQPSRLASILAKASINAPPQPPTSSVVLPAPPAQVPPPSGTWLPRGILKVSDPTPLPQKYMMVNCRAMRPEDATQLKGVLGGCGVQAQDITHYKLFMGQHSYNFLFNVSPDDEQKIEEKLFPESKWTHIFHASSFATNASFFAKSLSIGMFFQHVLVATRIDRPHRDDTERRRKVARARELRRALKNDKVLETLRGVFDGYGKAIIEKYQRELL